MDGASNERRCNAESSRRRRSRFGGCNVLRGWCSEHDRAASVRRRSERRATVRCSPADCCALLPFVKSSGRRWHRQNEPVNREDRRQLETIGRNQQDAEMVVVKRRRGRRADGSGQDVQPVVHLREQIAARLLDQLPEARQVDADQRAASLANRAADDDGIHVPHVRPLDDGADGVV